jgi:hypothetical protein
MDLQIGTARAAVVLDLQIPRSVKADCDNYGCSRVGLDRRLEHREQIADAAQLAGSCSICLTVS